MNAKRFFLTALSLLLILATLFPLASCGVTAPAATEAVTTAEPATAEITNPESIAAETTAEPAKYTVVLNAPSTTAIHTAMQAQYLAESDPDTASSYAAWKEELGRPNPIVLTWDVETELAESDIRAFTLRIWRKSAPRQTVSKVLAKSVRAYSFVNAMVGETYCWTVTATDGDGATYPSEVATFTTEDQAPRNLTIDGVTNVRDLGGWKTTDGKRVKQGLLFRTSALDCYSESERKMKDLVTPDGKSTLTDQIGIRTEIDLRRDHESESGYPPEGITESTLGEGVRYLHCPILLGPENYLNSIDSLRTIFGTLADPENYPVAYHCAVGADRTGAVTYLILGLLGVGDCDLMRDYLWTNFSNQQMYRPPINRGYKITLDETAGDTMQEKVRRVLSETIGIPEAELDRIAAFLTE